MRERFICAANDGGGARVLLAHKKMFVQHTFVLCIYKLYAAMYKIC